MNEVTTIQVSNQMTIDSLKQNLHEIITTQGITKKTLFFMKQNLQDFT